MLASACCLEAVLGYPAGKDRRGRSIGRADVMVSLSDSMRSRRPPDFLLTLRKMCKNCWTGCVFWLHPGCRQLRRALSERRVARRLSARRVTTTSMSHFCHIERSVLQFNRCKTFATSPCSRYRNDTTYPSLPPLHLRLVPGRSPCSPPGPARA